MPPVFEQAPYSVTATGGKYLVSDATNRTIMVCSDSGSAEQYALLLNAAYRQGYKAGIHESRSSDERREEEG
jgi:hypothetical protein